MPSSVQTDLFAAVDRKDVKAVKAALAAGAKPNLKDAQKYYPLETAIELQSKLVARTLLDEGADPSVRGRKPAAKKPSATTKKPPSRR